MGMGTVEGAVYSAPIGRDERRKGFPEGKEFDGGPFGYSN
jgi:hypothetical protein